MNRCLLIFQKTTIPNQNPLRDHYFVVVVVVVVVVAVERSLVDYFVVVVVVAVERRLVDSTFLERMKRVVEVRLAWIHTMEQSLRKAVLWGSY